MESVWGPQTIEFNGKLSFENDFKPFNKLLDSSQYLARLEAKLNRIKGSHKELSSKDVLKSFTISREDHLSHLMDTYCEFSEDSLDTSDGSIYTAIERKLFPQRNSINSQELVKLLESDYLMISKDSTLECDDKMSNSESLKKVIEN